MYDGFEDDYDEGDYMISLVCDLGDVQDIMVGVEDFIEVLFVEFRFLMNFSMMVGQE